MSCLRYDHCAPPCHGRLVHRLEISLEWSHSHTRSCYDSAGDSPLSVRHLDAFQLCQVGDLAKMEPLEEVDGVSESIVAQGQVIPADAIGAGDPTASPLV